MVTMSLATVGNNKGDNLTGKIDVGQGLSDVGKDGSAGIRKQARGSSGRGIKGKVKEKLEFAPHGRNAVDVVSAVDGAAIPSITGNHGGFNPNKGRAAIGASDGDGFVEVAKEVFNADRFVITTGSSMEPDSKEGAGIGKDTAEGTIGIDNDEATHTDFEQDLLEKVPS
jgi:hypothetical protein